MNQLHLTSSDVTHLQALPDFERPVGPNDEVPPSLLADLAALVPCDEITFQLMDPVRQWTHCQTFPAEHDAGEDVELDALFWASFPDSPACNYPQRTGDHHTITRLSDFYSRGEVNRGAAGEYERATHVQHEMLVPLPMLDPLDRRLLLTRLDGRDFTEREVLLLGLVRPHVIEAHLRVLRRRRGRPELTRRQWDILRLLAAGCSNRQTARALAISEATVSKHLENLYTRLGVNSRTEALAQVTPLERDSQSTVA